MPILQRMPTVRAITSITTSACVSDIRPFSGTAVNTAARYTACRDQCLLQAVCHRRAAVYRQLDDILADTVESARKNSATLVHLGPVRR